MTAAPEVVSSALTSDEKLMGALVYFLGAIVALIIWATQKGKSRFVRFHALQALAFDAVVMAASFFISFCLMTVIFTGMFGLMFSAVNDPASIQQTPYLFMFPALLPFGIFACVFPFSIVVLFIRLFAAGSVLSGRDFRYPVLGRKVEQFLKG
jgi:uncharacterized membrane protein